MNETLKNRTQSGFPVSIPTSLALESLFEPVQKVYDPDRVIPEMVDLSKYDSVLINANTLLRNIIGSIPTIEVGSIPTEEYKEVLLEEISYLEGMFALLDIDFTIYINDYTKPLSKYSLDILRQATTPKQQHIVNLVEAIEKDLSLIDDIWSCKGELKPASSVQSPDKQASQVKDRPKSIIITHIPYDLLSYHNFSKLDLLETHTGILKTRKDWHTKYYPVPNEDMSFLPLNTRLLSILGDHVMFKPLSIAYRKELLSTLRAKHVTPLSNDGTIDILINKVPAPTKK